MEIVAQVRKLQNILFNNLLSSMTWEQLDLSLSHHIPMSKVTTRRCGIDQAYIHGSCNHIGCPEQCHLYEISLGGESVSNILVGWAMA